MFAFAFRRTLQSFPTIAAVALVVFVLFSVIPGSIATSMSDDGRGAMDAEVVERMRKELGLDEANYQTREQVIDVLLEHPELMERPVVFAGERALICRPSEKVLELLD